MHKLTALIVDDEIKAVELLYKLLVDTGQFGELHTATSAKTASEILAKVKPDIIFLDIRMPDMDGFALLEALRKDQKESEIIFVTAYDQYAMQALKTHAFDYLLKPVDRKELQDCIMEFMEHRQKPDIVGRLEQLLHGQKETQKLRISTRTGYLFIDTACILYCQADGNYTLIDLGDRQHLCSLQLGALEELLPRQSGFCRLGRSLIVNFGLIARVDRKTGTVTFERDHSLHALTLSKSQLKELDKIQDA